MAEDRLRFLKSQMKFPQSVHNKPKWDLVLEKIKRLEKNSAILDIGFGHPFLSSFVGHEYDIYGVDVETEFLRNLDPSHYKCGNVEENIPFEDSKFDCIVMLELIEHLADTGNVYQEIKRVLKPGGIVLISTPNYSLFPSLLQKLLEMTYFRMFGKGYSHIGDHHINRYSKQRLFSELNQFFDSVVVRVFSYTIGLFAIGK